MTKKPVTSASITLPDVAREANVSVATAARVLRASSYPVSADLVSRVEAAAKKLGYVPNLLARNLRGQARESLGLIVGNMRDPYFGEIAGLITTGAFERSLVAMVANMHRDPALEIEICRKLFEHRIGGLILAGGGFDQSTQFDELSAMINRVQRDGVTVVALSERRLPIPVFSAQDSEVGSLLAGEALRGGHSNIGVISASAGSFVTHGRLKGLKRTLKRSPVNLSVVYAPELTLAGAASAVDELLRMNKQLSIILAASDTLGVGAIIRLQELKLHVPDDVSVISVGNTGACELSSPRLSSIDTKLSECCSAAIDYIVSVWGGRGATASATFIPRLVKRGSSI